MTDGEVRKVDLDNGKITLKRGDIKNLDMPGMTMVFYRAATRANSPTSSPATRCNSWSSRKAGR